MSEFCLHQDVISAGEPPGKPCAKAHEDVFAWEAIVIFCKLREKTPALIPTQYTQDKM